MIFDSSGSILQWFADEMFYRYPNILLPKDIIAMYDDITTDTLLEVANKVLDPEKINISLLQPKNSQKNSEVVEEIKNVISRYK